MSHCFRRGRSLPTACGPPSWEPCSPSRAWPVALLAARSVGRYSRFVERLSWSGHALPGIVVALSLVAFGARLPWAYQTLGMLVFAYMVLFLPLAIGAIRTSLLQITPSIEEASRLLGAGPVETFWRVVLPLTRPGWPPPVRSCS